MSGPGPTISVVIPAHQAERYLAESIDSVLAQDHPATEVLVVDDGSTDATATIAASFGDPVRLLRHEVNRGEAAARNTGLAEARGEVISMHDADDRMLPHRLRTELEALVAGDDDLGCVLAKTHAFTEDGGPLPHWALDLDGEPLSYGNALVLAWRSTYDRVGGYDETFVTGTDSDWLVRVRAAGLQIRLVDVVVTERRIHDANLTTVHGGGPNGYLSSLRKVMAQRRAAE